MAHKDLLRRGERHVAPGGRVHALILARGHEVAEAAVFRRRGRGGKGLLQALPRPTSPSAATLCRLRGEWRRGQGVRFANVGVLCQVPPRPVGRGGKSTNGTGPAVQVESGRP